MKKQLVFAGFLLAFAGVAKAQPDWNTSGNFFSGTVTPVLGSNSGAYPIVFRTAGFNRAILTDAGDFGLGTTTPAAKLDVWSQIPSNTTTASHFGIKSELIYAGSSFFPWFTATAVSGKAITYSIGYGRQIGVYGEAVDGNMNWGGHFYASGNTGINLPVDYNFGISTGASGNPGNGNFGGDLIASGSGGFNTGVSGTASGNPSGQNIGVFGSATGDPASGNIGGFFQYSLSSNPLNDWAVFSNGDSKATGFWINSDRKLKDNIKPVANAMDNIMLLKPSTYTYRQEEFKTMNLPAGEQTGLIAQELEAVFPAFVRNVGKITIQRPKGEADIVIPEHKAINYISLIPVLISGIQEQQAVIKEQQKTIEQQSQINANLQKQIDELKAIVNGLTGNENTTKTSAATSALTLDDKNTVVLNQNVPNPFAESTAITYNIPDGFQKAQMIFFTIDGKIIKTHDIKEKGAGVVNVFADNLSSGIYTYALVIDGKTIATKKMIRQ